MTRNWLFCRLPRQLRASDDDHTARAVSDVVPELVRYLRVADPGGRWFFQRLNDHLGPNLGLWFHSTAPVRRELERKLHVGSTMRGWPMTVDRYEPPAPRDPDTRSAELSLASSDFALDLLREGELPADNLLPIAIRHLRHMVELIPAGDRSSFLFFYWQHWTSDLSPGQRKDLGVRADREAAAILHAAAEIRAAEHLEESWQRYLPVIREIMADRRPGNAAPASYLLFEHIHLTHNRLGVPLVLEALAAQVLRTALRKEAAGTGSAAAMIAPRRTPVRQLA